MRPKRNLNPRPRKRALLIQCEGLKTEPNYLEEFCKACGIRHSLVVKVKPGKGQNAAVTVEAAIAEGRRRLLGEQVYDEVWCVLDVEHAAHKAKLNEAITLAGKYGIRLFLSNPSFEVWLISHFERTKRDFADSDATEAHLNTHWKKHFGCDYEKGDPGLYFKLKERLGDAQVNAQWVLETFHSHKPCWESNPSTMVYQVINELLTRSGLKAAI